MILDIGKPETMEGIYPCKIFDAHGVEIQLCIRCNTETGEATSFVPDASGHAFEDPGNLGEAKKITRIYPTPLRVEKLNP